MATGTTPAMCMRLTGIGSQYIYAMRDSDREFFEGGRNYRPWSFIPYGRGAHGL